MENISVFEEVQRKEEEQKSELFFKIEEFKKEDKDFKRLLTEIEIKLKLLIDMAKGKRDYKPNYLKPKVEITVEAIKINSEEFDCLLRYLKEKYIANVRGDYFCIKKKLFSNKYKIYTKSDSDWYDDYCFLP